MKKYNVQNYVRYKLEVEEIQKTLPEIIDGDYTPLTNDEMIKTFLLLVFNLAHKQSTSQQASGVMSINDLIQEGNLALTAAVGKVDRTLLKSSDDQEKTLKSFLSKRIKGAIRRAVDKHRGDIRIPEHKLNEIRRNPKDERMVAMFFNSVFSSIDDKPNVLNTYLLSLMKIHLDAKQYEVIRLSYGLNCDKHSANEIAAKLGINVSTAHVRISQIKREGIQRLIDNVDHSQVIDYL